eukprot:3277200-Pyramimonas_sp.AAC.1
MSWSSRRRPVRHRLTAGCAGRAFPRTNHRPSRGRPLEREYLVARASLEYRRVPMPHPPGTEFVS